jgi:hypothetical protein
MSLAKTFHIAVLIALLFVLQITLAPPARAASDAQPDPAATTTISTARNVAQPYIPLTHSQRVHQWTHDMFSVEAVVRAAAGAAILQGMDTPHEWGLGTEGYARRFGSDYAQHVIRQTLIFGASDLLDEDNRYFRSGLTGTGPRMRYAIESTFLARRHDGHRRLSYSRLTSVAATAFISREWQPRSTSGPSHAELSIATVLGAEIGFNIAREFLPKIFHTPVRPSDSR